MTDKLKGTCSVCLSEMQLRGDYPIRHGFNAHNVHHGATGGWHTGPCAGTAFPNLAISCEGTKHGLKLAHERKNRADHEIARLEEKPTLTWSPTNYRTRSPDMSRSVELKAGEDVPYSSDGRPTYANELKRRINDQKSISEMMALAIWKYEKVISTWAPGKYPVTGAAPKLDTVHLARSRTHPRFGNWTGITCKMTRPGLASDRPKKTTDISEVTCKKCKKTVGIP